MDSNSFYFQPELWWRYQFLSMSNFLKLGGSTTIGTVPGGLLEDGATQQGLEGSILLLHVV